MDARSLYRVSPWTCVHDAHLPTATDRRAHTRTVQGPMAYRCVWGTHGYGRPVRRCILIVVSLLGNGHCFFPALAFRFLCAWPWCSSDVLQLTPPSFFSTTHRLADALVCLFVRSFGSSSPSLLSPHTHIHIAFRFVLVDIWDNIVGYCGEGVQLCTGTRVLVDTACRGGHRQLSLTVRWETRVVRVY